MLRMLAAQHIQQLYCLFFQTVKSIFPISNLLVAAVFVSSCIPLENQKNSSSRGMASTPSDSSQEDDDTPPPSQSGALYWFIDGHDVTGAAVINESIESVIYLRGSEIHTYIRNGNEVPHCIVFNYHLENQKKQLRSRAIPITYNPPGGVQEKLFRIDIPSSNENQDMCSGTAPWFNNSGIEDGSLTTTGVSFRPNQLCPGCSGIVPSTNISIHRENIAPMTLVQSFDLDLQGLQLRIDISNSSSNPDTSCTNSVCRAQGYDCCQEGQCVNDGEVRPGVDTSSELYLQALSEIDENPLSFTDYPEIFYICSIGTPPDPTPPPPTDPKDEASERFSKLKNEYLCLEEGKKSDPNYGVGYCSDEGISNQNSCLNEQENWYFHCRVGQCSDPNFFSRQSCRDADETWEEFYDQGQEHENGSQEAYFTIRNTVWKNCGCDADPFPSSPEEPHCPDFGLKPVYASNGEIQDIICDVPDPDTEPPPFQDLNLSLSARTAPHRFFDSDGVNHDDLSELYNSGTKQEGEEFFYADEGSLASPTPTSFSMNAVLGQMSVQLNKAHPARVVHVDFDQTYIISATSGFYTPCPTCASDSWFEAFRPYPSSQGGRGLQSTGFSTSRNQYQNNLTLGNYEDTIFGRACWIPPTMIPFTHRSQAHIDDQRRDRLKTQAALYINGYQRDWFGFNQGALIGSFDGVSWFAIGNGRRVVSNSNKLFLAINAPFADLADASDISVSVVQDLGGNTVADHDFDPDLSLNSSRQNQGATCRAHHQCDVDADCITRLGWEYACVDVDRYQTKWPRFNINAEEREDLEKNITNLSQLLVGGMAESDSSRRCVYRGRGSLCKRDWSSGTGNNSELQKAFRCAPNFYCAEITSGSGFNNELVREPAGPFAILFGQDANVLGRPKNYVSAPNPLTSDIRDNIFHNFSMMLDQTSEMGICLPGKQIDQNLITQHTGRDLQRRTDYISQISSCNASGEGLNRYMSCPAIGSDGNYLYGISQNSGNTHIMERARQNMCGSESKRETFNGDIVSTFQEIEAEPLSTLTNLISPKVVRDACLRRAGSVCHTDLDCGPGPLHQAQAQQQGEEFFGGTIAEKKFWEEGLTCGQSQTPPAPTSPEAEDYSMSFNRCCRGVGSDFTMYTEHTRINSSGEKFDITASDPQIISNQMENSKLRTFKTPLNSGTAQEGRYSRYAGLQLFDLYESDSFSIPDVPYAQAPMIHYDVGNNRPVTPKIYQWKAINDTGRQNCCGGGWVRKFSDGSNNWSNRQRLQIPPETFECINQPWSFYDTQPSTVVDANYNIDRDSLCLSPGEGGCVQYNMEVTDEFEIKNPSSIPNTARLNTTPVSEDLPFVQEKDIFTPFQPRRYLNIIEPNAAQPNFNFAFHNFFSDEVDDSHGFSIYLPLYIGGRDNINSVTVRYLDSDGREASDSASQWYPRNGFDQCVITTNPANVGTSLIDPSPGGLGPDADAGAPEVEWCVTTDIGCWDGTIYTTDNRPTCLGLGHQWQESAYEIMHIRTHPDRFYDNDDEPDFMIAGVEIDFNVMGQGDTVSHPENMFPGNPLFYTSKLARLELLGIPQIFHEPIYCSNDKDTLIPNIYDLSGAPLGAPDREAFEDHINSFPYNFIDSGGEPLRRIYRSDTLVDAHSNPDEKVVFQDGILLQNVFSDSEFQCCLELGHDTPEAGNCCSGHETDGQCTLPSGTNLNVYFNKFVSSEGMRSDLESPLTDQDFVPETGEPKFNTGVYNKLSNLGQTYCESGEIRRGGSTGFFFPKPNSGFFEHQDASVQEEDMRYLGLVDSNQDIDNELESGYSYFVTGFRWRHQLYCK